MWISFIDHRNVFFYANDVKAANTTKYTQGDYEYTLDGSIATITKYNGVDKEVTIPNLLDGKEVREIGKSAFANNNSIESLTIPKNIRKINDKAFHNLANLEKLYYNTNYISSLETYEYQFGDIGYSSQGVDIVIGDGVKKIPDYFMYCNGATKSKIKSVTMSDSVTSIGKSAFKKMSDLSYIKWSNNIETIDESAFEECSGLRTIDIPTKTKYINKCAFDECKNVETLTIPKSVKSIRYKAFYGLENLEKLNYNSIYVTSHESYEYTFNNIGKTSNGVNITIGNGVKKIPDYFMYNNTVNSAKIKSVTMANTVTSIGRSAFKNMKDLISIRWSSNLRVIGESSFAGCTGLKSVTLPVYTTTIDKDAFYGCSNITSIKIYPYVKSIGYDALIKCASNMKVYCYKGSYAEKYAKNNKLKVVYLAFPSVNKTSFASIKKASKTALTITWKKASGANGYEIFRSTKKNAGYVRVVTIKNGNTVRFVNSKLKAKQVYYYKIRSYRVVYGIKVYSGYSVIKVGATK